jgi:hypothetical protein
MFELKARNQSNRVHALNPTGIGHAFNTHQRKRYQYAGNDSEQANSETLNYHACKFQKHWKQTKSTTE